MKIKKQLFVVCLVLALSTFAAFWPVKDCDFINYDDPLYVTDNIYVRQGITFEGIVRAFTSSCAANWHPVTILSHMLDVQVFGLNPGRHHQVNLFLHIINTLLLFLIFQRMTRAVWPSAFMAALFGLHPLHVESVAWIAERKDVLSTFFWMLTMWAYVLYVERPGIRRYVPVLIFFILGLMTKPMLVTLPFFLILLDFWPLGRFQPAGSQLVRKDFTLIGSLLREKVPLFALALLASIITYIAQQSGGAIKSLEAYPIAARIANAFVSWIAYAGNALWPDQLAVLYPYVSLPSWQILGAVLLFTAVTLIVIWKAAKYPYLAMGWFTYVGTLVPVIGFVQVGAQARADRYTYFPLIGIFIMVSWGVPELLKRFRHHRAILVSGSALVIACFFTLTWRQVGYWKDSIRLFEHALQVTGPNSIALCLRGGAYEKIDDHQNALRDLSLAIEIDPRYSTAFYNRGVVYDTTGNHRRAIEDFDRAIQIDPGNAVAYGSRGTAYGKLGDQKQALANFDKAIEIDPGSDKNYFNRAIALGSLGRFQSAIEDYDRALKINPGYAEAYCNRGIAYGILGDLQTALGNFGEAIRLNPVYAKAYYNRAAAYSKLGNQKQALEDLRKAEALGGMAAQKVLRTQNPK